MLVREPRPEAQPSPRSPRCRQLCWSRAVAPGPAAGTAARTAQSLAEKTQYNPQPYENIRDGGTLTTSLPEISPQFNTFHLDGTTYTLAVWRWYNPILITFTPDGQAVYNPDYLTDVKPETVDGNTRITYTINPKATYNDGSPIDWRVVRVDLEDQQRHGPGLPRRLHRRLRPDHLGRPGRRRPAGRGDLPGHQPLVAGPVQRAGQPEGRRPGRVQPGLRHHSAQRVGRGPLPGAEVRPAERRHRLRAQPEVVGQAGQAGHPDLRDVGGRRQPQRVPERSDRRRGRRQQGPVRAGAGTAGHRDPQGPVAAAGLLHAERREPGPVRPAGAEGDLRGHRPRADRQVPLRRAGLLGRADRLDDLPALPGRVRRQRRRRSSGSIRSRPRRTSTRPGGRSVPTACG